MFPKNSKVRLIVSNNKQSARLNMATDEALINSFHNNDIPILRIYSWEKSFTIGASQKFNEFISTHDYSHNFAKRITGGGLLYHGFDISYSLLIPKSYMSSLNVKQSYEYICNFLLEFYKNLGLSASYAKDLNFELSKNKFCQIGFEAYDIIINNIKIGGNAQKRTKNIIFQHGSIPIEKIYNNHIKEIGKSLFDFGINLSYELSQLRLISAFEKIFHVRLEKSLLTIKEKEELELLLRNKYNYEKYNTN